jgi:hypothetical protein
VRPLRYFLRSDTPVHVTSTLTGRASRRSAPRFGQIVGASQVKARNGWAPRAELRFLKQKAAQFCEPLFLLWCCAKTIVFFGPAEP